MTDQFPPHEMPPAQTPAGQTAADPIHTERSRPRTGPIIWGALILVFCGYIAQRAFSGAAIDTTVWVTATVIGLGVLLLGVGAAVLIRGSGTGSRQDTRSRSNTGTGQRS